MKIVELNDLKIRKQNTFLRASVPVEKRVAIALWQLTTGDAYCAVDTTCRQGKSFAIAITHEACRTIINVASRCIKLCWLCSVLFLKLLALLGVCDA